MIENTINKFTGKLGNHLNSENTQQNIFHPFTKGITLARSQRIDYDRLYDVYELHELQESNNSNKRVYFYDAQGIELERNEPITSQQIACQICLVISKSKLRHPIFKRNNEDPFQRGERAEVIAQDSFIYELMSDSHESTIFYTCKSHDSEA